MLLNGLSIKNVIPSTAWTSEEFYIAPHTVLFFHQRIRKSVVADKDKDNIVYCVKFQQHAPCHHFVI